MSNHTYTFQTPERGYDIVPQPHSNIVEVRSEDRDSLEEMLGTIELYGADDNTDFSKIEIREGQNEYDFYNYIHLTKDTLALYFQAEILNFMGVDPE